VHTAWEDAICLKIYSERKEKNAQCKAPPSQCISVIILWNRISCILRNMSMTKKQGQLLIEVKGHPMICLCRNRREAEV
jgi:hypothetical protein